MATIKQVSQLARVSKATVSQVLNNPALVSEGTRARVLDAIESLDFRPNAFAQSLATNRSNSVGIVAQEITSAYFGALLNGIEAALEAAGMHLMVANGHGQPQAEARAVEFLIQRRADALILNLEEPSQHDLGAWAQRGVPTVVLGRKVPGGELPCVYHDHERGGRLAAAHLIAHGHERIVYLKGSVRHPSEARFEGYRRALQEAGLPLDGRLVVEANQSETGGRAALRQLLAEGVPFTALFATNDEMAAGAMIALREAGLDVPRDVSVVGYDDLLLARCLYPPLTTVRQPLGAMGRAAALLALKALGRAPGKEVKRKFDPSLVERQSVARVG